MKKVTIFAGTSEGRRLAELCDGQGISVTVCVATEYGEKVLPELQNGTVHTGRMDQAEMKGFLEKEAPEVVVDATHPYAEIVSQNLESVCREIRLEYCRLERESLVKTISEAGSLVKVADSVAEAAGLAEKMPGKIFLATGSKELSVFCEKISELSRLYVRILPVQEALEKCTSLGLEARQLICMQGPFSEEMNYALFRQTGASVLITKESGAAGGFPEKLRAAAKLGMSVIVIRRPQEKKGLPFEEVCLRLGIDFEKKNVRDSGPERMPEEDKKQESTVPEITVIGIGIGSRAGMTGEAKEALAKAEIIFGAKRMLESIGYEEKEKVCLYQSADIKEYLKNHPEFQKIAVVFSGDVGFYSGAGKFCKGFAEYSVYSIKLICGVSSMNYFAAKLHMSWQDMKLCSCHGRNCNLPVQIRREKKVFCLFGKSGQVRELALRLIDFNMVDIKFHIGINLGYREEQYLCGFPKDFTEFSAEGLCVGIFENPIPDQVVTPGFPDKNFIRGNVPMTKEEVRELVLCKLRLKRDSVVYDVGAGTGSVSIECARMAPDGKIYAIEKKKEALELLKGNRRLFAAAQVEIVAGEAPEVLEELDVPTHAFIGGSGGRLREILMSLLRKNRGIRIVVTAVTLETQSEMTGLLKELPLTDVDVVSVLAARAEQLGKYHLWRGENPVMIFSFSGADCGV